MITTNAGNLAVRQRARSALYIEEVEKACRQNAEVVKKKAQQFSQRRFFSLEDLRRMGHPYAVRAPHPPVAAHILSRQSGKLYGMWKVSVVKTDPNRVVYTVYNRAPYAKYMMGTTKMIPRPILDEALTRTKDERARNIKRARDRAYQRARRAI